MTLTELKQSVHTEGAMSPKQTPKTSNREPLQKYRIGTVTNYLLDGGLKSINDDLLTVEKKRKLR